MILSKYLDYATFGFVDQAGALIALVGVVLIVQPNTVFGLQDKSTLPENSSSIEMIHNTIKGVAYSAMGVLGGIVSFQPRITPLRRHKDLKKQGRARG